MPELIAQGKIFRPRGGFPFRQLPADDVTPESIVNEQIRTGRQEIQQQFNLAWNEISRSKRFIGAAKSQRMQQELHTKAKQEMLRFNQQAQAQMVQIQNVNRLAEQGMIYNPDEVKARMVFGTDVARSMYPKPKSVEQQFGALEIHGRKLESRLAQFRRPKKKLPLKIAGIRQPLLKAGKVPGDVEIYDRSMIDEETGDMGVWRPATQQEIAERRMLVEEQSRVKRLQTEVLGQSDVRQRVVQPGTKGGTFGDKVTESIGRPTKRHDPLGLFD